MRKINKEHPDYPKYIEKCKALAKRIDAELSEIEPMPSGRNERSVILIRKKEAQELKKLQEEYSHLFTEAYP